MKRFISKLMIKPQRSFHHQEISYGFLRAALGLNVAMHGVVHLACSDLAGVSRSFLGHPFLQSLVNIGIYFLGPAEFLLGFMILIGYRTRFMLSTGAFFTIVYMAAKALEQHWTTVGLMMVNVLFYYILLDRLSENRISLDTLRAQKEPVLTGMYE